MGRCPVPGCDTHVPRHLLLCAYHWGYLTEVECARLWRYLPLSVNCTPGETAAYNAKLRAIVLRVERADLRGEPPRFDLTRDQARGGE